MGIDKDVNFYRNKCSYGYKTLQFDEFMQQMQSKILQQAKCVVIDFNFYVNNYLFLHKALYFHELS